jgi:hypothetical protein
MSSSDPSAVIRQPVLVKHPILISSFFNVAIVARFTKVLIKTLLSVGFIPCSHRSIFSSSINHESSKFPMQHLTDLPYPASIGWTASVRSAGRKHNTTFPSLNIFFTDSAR